MEESHDQGHDNVRLEEIQAQLSRIFTKLEHDVPLHLFLSADKIPVLWNTEVKEIRGDKRVEEVLLADNQTGETSPMPVDGVFISIGYLPEVELAKQAGVELTPEGYIKSDRRHHTSAPGINLSVSGSNPLEETCFKDRP